MNVYLYFVTLTADLTLTLSNANAIVIRGKLLL